MENLALTVGKNLASLRKAKGMTQQELAQKINYSDKSISKWELGYALPSVDVLLDFANFYGVTIDYLVSEQTPENIAQVVEQKNDDGLNPSNKAIILAMSLTFVVLVAMSIFFSSYFFNTTQKDMTSVFFWMVPFMALVSAIEVQIMYKNRMAKTVLLSIFVWTFLLSFCFQFQFFRQPPENIWIILIVGAPIQVIIVLLYNYKKK